MDIDKYKTTVNYSETSPLTITSGERRVHWSGRWKSGWYLRMTCCFRNLFDYLVDECYGSEIEPLDTLDYFNMISDLQLTEDEVFNTLNEKRHVITKLPNGKWWLEDFWVIQTDVTELKSVTKGKHSPMRKACYRNGVYPLDVRGILKINEKVKEFIDYEEYDTSISINNNNYNDNKNNTDNKNKASKGGHTTEEYNKLLNDSLDNDY